jgi:RHS repeat-associated protein
VTRSKQTTDGVVYGTDAAPMTYTYNLSGAMIEQKYPSGRVVKNVLDNDGDLSIVQSKKNANSGFFNYAKNFTYTSAGAVSSMQIGNNRWESTQFNSRLQPTQIALGTTQGTADKLKLDYSYGGITNNGNVLSQTITVPTVGSNNGFTATQTYTYDSLNRLKDAKEMIGTTQTWKQTFLYDRYGNRNFDTTANRTTTIPSGCSTAVCNPGVNVSDNRLKTSDGYVFDNAGNTTKDAQLRKFTYDAENKQVKVETVNSGGTVIATNGEYVYDGDGKRVKKKGYTNNILTEETIFVYDAAGKLVAEYSTNVAPASTAQVSYLTNDHLGSPRINTDANGAVISRHDYMPFGEEIPRANYGNDSVRQKFTGYERDTETSLDYAKARMHSYNLGRFTSPDPIMMSKERLPDPQSINLYVYARNNPLKYVDPNGEEFKGTDGKTVVIENVDGQWVIKSDNASKDLIRLVGLVNGSGSSTANSQFNRLNAHKTMVNFAFGDKDPQGVAGGRHQPHGTKPDGSKGALKFEDGKFQGEVDIVKDSNGNEVYAEATITIYEGMYRPTAEGDSVEDQMVGTFGHESEHDLDPKQVQETKNKTYRNEVYHPENPDRTPVKGSPYWMNQQIVREIREFRNKPKCPPGHMCF